ncbi:MULTISPECIES: hypothetical protein [Rhodopirellula]|nr:MULTISPECIES: hypothetical protein [Rhodopirellula]
MNRKLPNRTGKRRGIHPKMKLNPSGISAHPRMRRRVFAPFVWGEP